MKPAFFGWGSAGQIAMLLPSRVAGRTVDLRGPDLARGPEVAPPMLYVFLPGSFWSPSASLPCSDPLDDGLFQAVVFYCILVDFISIFVLL